MAAKTKRGLFTASGRSSGGTTCEGRADVQMLSVVDDAGRALSYDDERKLLDRCAVNRSKTLLPVVTLPLNTGMRYSELLTLKWNQIDLAPRGLVVGQKKTAAGTGRPISYNGRSTATLIDWSARFPERRSEHFVLPGRVVRASPATTLRCTLGDLLAPTAGETS